MESPREHPYLKFKPENVHIVRKMYNLNKPGRMDEAIDILVEWIKKQNHFTCKEFDRRYLEGLIINSKGSIETAKSRLDKLCTVRTMLPEFFPSVARTANKMAEHAVMPDLTQEGYRIFIYRTRENLIITSKTFSEILIDVNSDCEYILKNDYNAGIIGVLDLRTLNLMDAISKIDLSLLRISLCVLRDGYGFRIKALHFISNSKFLENFISFLKPALPTKIANRVHVYSTREAMYDIVPKKLLSKDYGGYAPLLSELNELRIEANTSEEHMQHMKKIRQCRTDESKRIGARPDTDYLPGNFRNLTVD